LDGEREKIVLTIAFPGYKGARRKAYLIASEETGAESTVNPTLQAIATAGFSSCVSIRGPCLVLIANSVGDLVVTKRSDFPLFVEGFRRRVICTYRVAFAKTLPKQKTPGVCRGGESSGYQACSHWRTLVCEGRQVCFLGFQINLVRFNGCRYASNHLYQG
jgi:hypothetical protein